MTDQEQKAFDLMREALELAMENLRPHGDNCFLHDEGEYNACFCGKDSLVDHLQSVVESAALTAANAVQPQAQGDAEIAGAQSRFKNVAVWTPCSVEHHQMVQLNPNEWDGYETRLVYAHPQATEPAGSNPIGWYSVSRDGIATLCVDRKDAEKTAKNGNKYWPKHAPYRAVQLFEAPEAKQ